MKTLEEDTDHKNISWWQYIINKLTENVNPCMDYCINHKIETIILIILLCMIIYQITFTPYIYTPIHIIQHGGEGEAPAGEGHAPPGGDANKETKTSGKGSLGGNMAKGLGKGALSVGKGIGKGLGKVAASSARTVGNQISSGISEPLKTQWDKLAPFRENTGESVKSYIYKLLELAVIMLIFFPCVSLFLIILASYYMIKPKLKFIKGL